MPQKTIYIKPYDAHLLKKLKERPGESISLLFSEFLRERVTERTPEEEQLIELIKKIGRKREAVSRDKRLPDFLVSEYMEAERYAEMSLRALREGKPERAKAQQWAAVSYYEQAERAAKETKALVAKITHLLGQTERHIKPPARPRFASP